MTINFISRREFIRSAIATLLSMPALEVAALAAAEQVNFQGKQVFDRIIAKAVENKWQELPIGELMGKLALELEGTPYKGSTLELSPDREFCSVNLNGLDCVTFFETTLGMARMLKKGGRTPAKLLKEISFTRYRHGKPGDYSTRLHYTTDWFEDNESKHVVKVLSDLPGAEAFSQKVSYMSEHPEASIQLKAHPELLAKIKQDEDAINQRSMMFIPLAKLAEVEPLLKTGDIVGICTAQPGLDIAHTGLVLRTADGIAHFMDASSRKGVMKVTVEPGPLSHTIAQNKHATGAMFARPLEP
jgi:hypothetical protein